MILIFTGNGKGKTTAALGQAIRALGHGKNAIIIQFIKGPWISGEDKFFANHSPLTSHPSLLKCGKGFVGILGDKFPISEHKKAAQNGLKIAAKAIRSKKYDLIVLDEINNAVDLKLVKSADVLKILKSAHPELDVILTGRNAPKSFIKFADLVTEMKEIKHPFQKNKKSMKKGVEY